MTFLISALFHLSLKIMLNYCFWRNIMFFLEDLRPHSSVLRSSSNPLEIMREEIICPYFLVQIILHPGGFPITFSAFFFTSLFWPLMVDLRKRKIGRWVGSFLICLSYPSHLYIANHWKLTVCFRWPGLQLSPFILFSVFWGLPHIFLFSDTIIISSFLA